MKASIRVRLDNPNHHIWNNNGTWWCHFSVHLPGYTAERRRLSLKTKDVTVARFLRDSVLHEYDGPSSATEQSPHRNTPARNRPSTN